MLDPEITSSARLRILAVEADPHVRAVAVDTLEEAGFEVIEAATADRAAIILHARNDPSVVFTDAVTSGELNGLDLARMALTLHPQVVAIVVPEPCRLGSQVLHRMLGFCLSHIPYGRGDPIDP
jgi:DNA-binding NtrC family response regulator